MTRPLLFGREREARLMTELMGALQDHGATLVVRGEPGIGKSSLLAFAKTQAAERAMQVLTTAGVESEAQYPFAGLHRLLRPIMATADTLPPHQKDVLGAAFGLTGAAAPNIFLIALAALNLLSDGAERTPLLLVVEDAQWLDRSTGDVLAFVARRLESDPILLLIAVRDGTPSPLADVGLPEVRLEGLDDEAARALLDACAPEFASPLREQLLAYALGNPLALVELPLAVKEAQLGGVELLPARLPLTRRLEEAFAARFATLPTTTRTLLIIAAINDSGYVAEVLAAGTRIERLELGLEGLAPAITTGLIEIDGPELRFRHPLVRSAIYQTATAATRYAAHAALAHTLSDQPIRRAWHRAASAGRPDEDVATELEAAAGQAQHQGAISCAVAGLERAAALTPDGLRRRTRLLRAAELAFELGRSDLADRLLRKAEPDDLTPVDLTPVDLGRVTLMREILDAEGPPPDALRVLSLIELADQVGSGGETELALTLLRVAALHFWSTDFGDGVRDRIVTAAERLPVDGGNPQLLVILAVVDPVRRGQVVFDRLALATFGPSANPHTTRLFAQAAFVVGDIERAATLLQETVTGLRVQGRLGLLAPAQALRAWAAIHLGDWKTALTAAEEAGRLAHETAQPAWEASAWLAEALLAGLRGDQEKAGELAERAERVVLPTGDRAALGAVQRARGVAALGAGHPADAFEHLRRTFSRSDPAYHPVERWWALSYLAEAAMYSGRENEARAVAEAMEPLVEQTPSPGLHVEMHYARAVLAPDADADALYQVALDAVRWPFIRARLNLAYGTWLRRQRRVAESRALLHAACAAFDALNAVPWSERARRELRASGVTSHPRTVGVSDMLSPQELQIVQMAATGLTNREIGQQLYLSPRTVASHLYRAFPKLGITSRHQLPNTLPN